MSEQTEMKRPNVQREGVTVASGKRWLGRLIAPDVNDANFRYGAVSDQLKGGDKVVGTKIWGGSEKLSLDQGQTPRCVGFSWTTLLVAGPVHQPGMIPDRDHAQRFADDLYMKCLDVDEFEGNDPCCGTSVRAAAKVLKSGGAIGAYLWAEAVADAVHFVLNHGPVVFGTVWPDSMMDTDKSGVLWVAPDSTMSGPHAQGHAYCALGVSTTRSFRNPYTGERSSGGFKICQTWGDEKHGPGPWGLTGDGFAWLPFAEADKLFLAQGEICMPTEQEVKPADPVRTDAIDPTQSEEQ